MAILVNVIIPVALMCGVCFDQTEAISEREYTIENHCQYQDGMLNKMATDVVGDVVRVLGAFAKTVENLYGQPKVAGFTTDFNFAGFDFTIRSDGGVFRGFPTLKTVGETKLSFSMNELGRSDMGLVVPISFNEFVTYFDRVVVEVGNHSWKGNLTMTVKKNQFLTKFQIRHSDANSTWQNEPQTCEVMIERVKTLQYTDAVLDLKVEGLPEFHLNNIVNHFQVKTTYTSYTVHELFDAFLGRRFDGYSKGVLNYCVFSLAQYTL